MIIITVNITDLIGVTHAQGTRTRNYIRKRTQLYLVKFFSVFWYQKLSNPAGQSNCKILVTCIGAKLQVSGTSVCHQYKLADRYEMNGVYSNYGSIP